MAQPKDAAALAAENAKLKAALAAAKETGVVSKPVTGSVKVKFETPDGEEVTKTIGFKNGRIRCALANGQQVDSELLLKVANGKELSEKELKSCPPLEGYTKENAIARLTYLASIGASFLELK